MSQRVALSLDHHDLDLHLLLSPRSSLACVLSRHGRLGVSACETVAPLQASTAFALPVLRLLTLACTFTLQNTFKSGHPELNQAAAV